METIIYNNYRFRKQSNGYYQGYVDGAIELFQKAYSSDLNLFEEIFEMVSTELKDFKLQEKQLWNLREYIKLRIN